MCVNTKPRRLSVLQPPGIVHRVFTGPSCQTCRGRQFQLAWGIVAAVANHAAVIQDRFDAVPLHVCVARLGLRRCDIWEDRQQQCDDKNGKSAKVRYRSSCCEIKPIHTYPSLIAHPFHPNSFNWTPAHPNEHLAALAARSELSKVPTCLSPVKSTGFATCTNPIVAILCPGVSYSNYRSIFWTGAITAFF